MLQSGGQVTLNWNDSNTGTGAATGGWSDYISVVNTTTGQPVLNAYPFYSGWRNVPAVGSTSRSINFTLPNGLLGVGQLQVTVTVDSNNSLLEYNPDGTPRTVVPATLSGTSTLAAYPDLQATGLAFGPSSVLQSGGQVTLNWSDSNPGSGAAIGGWLDYISVVNTTTGQPVFTAAPFYSANNVAAGGNTFRSINFPLPNGLAGVGELQVTVTADYANSVLEYNLDGTPRTVVPATLSRTSTLAAYPDLATTSIIVPTTAIPGQPVTISYSLANTGDGPANGPWIDEISFSSSADGSNPTMLGSSQFTGTISAGQSVSRTATVTLPMNIIGSVYFIVEADVDYKLLQIDRSEDISIEQQPTSIPSTLLLALSNPTVLKNAGTAATTATVTRNGDLRQPLVVTIASDHPSAATTPTTVTIPANQSSAPFTIGTIDDGLVDGNQTVALTASASGFVAGSNILTIQETDRPTLTLSISNQIFGEDAGSNAATAVLTRNADLSDPLVVSLTSNNINKVTVPATVTIPAGQTSFTFALTAVNDRRIDGPTSVTVSASANGLIAASQSVTVTEINAPTLSLSLADGTVSEAAGNAATTGSVSIPAASKVPLYISLSSNNTTAATVPSLVVISPGQTSATFSVAAVDDGLDDASKTAVISAQIETDAGVILTQGEAIADLIVVNADGPALSVTFPTSTVLKGGNITATITRNTDTSSALVVGLASSDDTKATVPLTVVIPAGQTSLTFTATTIDDHTPDGLQHVQITASAPSFASAIVPLGITDVDLPDLIVTNVTAPAPAVMITHLSTFHGPLPTPAYILRPARGLIKSTSIRSEGRKARLRPIQSPSTASSTRVTVTFRPIRSSSPQLSANTSCVS